MNSKQNSYNVKNALVEKLILDEMPFFSREYKANKKEAAKERVLKRSLM